MGAPFASCGIKDGAACATTSYYMNNGATCGVVDGAAGATTSYYINNGGTCGASSYYINNGARTSVIVLRSLMST